MSHESQEVEGLLIEQRNWVKSRVESAVAQLGRYPEGLEIHVEVPPLLDPAGQPTPLSGRAEHGSCGDMTCPYRHCIVEGHATEHKRDRASAEHRGPNGALRYHEDLDLGKASVVDVTSLRDLVNVEALDLQVAAALESVRLLRKAGANVVRIAQSAKDPHASLLLFCADLGNDDNHPIKTSGGRLRCHPPRKVRTPTPPGTKAGLRLHRLGHANWRAMLGALFIEAFLVYTCGMFASWLLNDGSRALTGRVTLPVWILAIGLTALGTGVAWMAWVQLRPVARLTRQRLRTLRRYMSRVLAELDAKGIVDIAEDHHLGGLGQPTSSESVLVEHGHASTDGVTNMTKD